MPRSSGRRSASTPSATPIRSNAGLAGELVGGLYGVKLGRAFFGESMFSRMTDASKVALAWLVARLKVGDFTLLDCQFMTDHLASLGAIDGQPRRLCRVAVGGARLGAAPGGGSRAGAALGRESDRRARRLPPPDFDALDRLLEATGAAGAAGPPASSSRSSWARRRRPDARRR